jgi:cytochrome c-type biogenesis protein CcmF
MIPELGHFALVLALVLALVQAVVPLVGAQRATLRPDGGRPACGAGPVLLHRVQLRVPDLGLHPERLLGPARVASNSHSETPLMYKITGVWGNHEGSLLLWAMCCRYGRSR